MHLAEGTHRLSQAVACRALVPPARVGVREFAHGSCPDLADTCDRSSCQPGRRRTAETLKPVDLPPFFRDRPYERDVSRVAGPFRQPPGSPLRSRNNHRSKQFGATVGRTNP